MLDMDSSSVSDLSAPRNTRCVECMCLMTLFQEHISSKHSGDMCLYFELSEWQQAGYKQSIKWTLECDRCDFKTTSKPAMFEHIANHQMLENTLQRINQSSASTPLPKPKQVITTQAGIAAIDKPVYNSTPSMDYHQSDARMPDYQSETSDISEQTPLHISATCSTSKPEHDDDSPVMIIKDEYPEPEVLIHMQESDIDEINKQRAQPPPPLDFNGSWNMKNGIDVDRPQSTASESEQALELKCKVCNFSGPTVESLMYHTRSEHKHFDCNLCSFVGGKAVELEEHMIKVHQSLLCIYCGVNGGNDRALRRHYSLDHRSKEKKCKRCNFTTSNQTVLTQHVNRVHLGKKPRPCPYCDYVTYTEAAVKQHVLAIHRKEKPFCCPDCPMSFARKFQVKEHLKRRHGILMSPVLSQSLDAGYKVLRGEIANPADVKFHPDQNTELDIVGDMVNPNNTSTNDYHLQ